MRIADRCGIISATSEMKKKKTSVPVRADITSEQLILSPEKDDISGIPAISHSFYTTNWHALPPHTHEGCIELCFCSRGSLVFECEGKTYSLMPDNVFLTQPGDRHHLTTNHKGMRMYWMFFRYPNKGRTVLGLSASETAALVGRLKAIEAHDFAVDHGMRQLFRNIFKAYAELPRGAYRTLVLRTLILRILIMTIQSADNRPSLKSLSRISDIAKMMERRPAHRFEISEMAKHAGLSESYFTALFRQVVGLPPYAYFAKCRLEAARRRLAETHAPIGAIARDLGYASPQHLTMQFRTTYGITPSGWRRQEHFPGRDSKKT